MIPQDRTEKIFFESLEALPQVETRFACDVQSVVDEGRAARVRFVQDGETREATAKFAIGCDGGRSFVRGAMGVKLEGETYGFIAALADLRLEGDVASRLPSPRVSTKSGLRFGVRIGANTWRVIRIMRSPEANAGHDVAASARALFGENARYDIRWQSDFRVHRRTAAQFSRGRVALAGDAAHLNSPLGGQGMNSGIIDSEGLRHALGRSLLADSTAPLEAFSRERKIAVERGVNRNTGFMTDVLFFRAGRYVKPLLRALNLLLKIPAARSRFLTNVAMLPADRESAPPGDRATRASRSPV